MLSISPFSFVPFRQALNFKRSEEIADTSIFSRKPVRSSSFPNRLFFPQPTISIKMDRNKKVSKTGTSCGAGPSASTSAEPSRRPAVSKPSASNKPMVKRTKRIPTTVEGKGAPGDNPEKMPQSTVTQFKHHEMWRHYDQLLRKITPEQALQLNVIFLDAIYDFLESL